MAGRIEMTGLVRFASTQRPEDIHDGNPSTSPGQSRRAGRHILTILKKPTSLRPEKNESQGTDRP
jgi:hypothetical protein